MTKEKLDTSSWNSSQVNVFCFKEYHQNSEKTTHRMGGNIRKSYTGKELVFLNMNNYYNLIT